MRRRACIPLALALTTLLVLAGCGGNSGKKVTGPKGDPTSELNAAYQALAGDDIADANLHFKNAIATDPSNAVGNLGVAVTEIALLADDPDVSHLLDLLDAASSQIPFSRTPSYRAAPAPIGRRPALAPGRLQALRAMGLPASSRFDVLTAGQRLFGFLLASSLDPGPISDLQQVVRNKVLPKLTYIETRLDLVVAQPDFVTRLPQSVTGLDYDLEIDVGDALVLDAAVNLVQGTARSLVAYNVDVPSYHYVNVESLLTTPGSEFGTLYPDGGSILSSARQDWLAAVDLMDQGVVSIILETDPQGDDLIPPDEFGTAGDVAELRDQLARLRLALNGPVYIAFTNRLGARDSVQVDPGKFFTDPIQDLKGYVPDHTFGLNHEFVTDDPLTFPDPTFHGILPGMTNDRIRQLLGIVQPPVPPAS